MLDNGTNVYLMAHEYEAYQAYYSNTDWLNQ